MIKPAALTQWILLLITSLTLCACIDEKDTELTLPPINPNLSTESPEGIWLWHMDIEASESYQDEYISRENQDRYFIRQLVVIKSGRESGELSLEGSCTNNYLPTNNIQSVFDGGFSSSLGFDTPIDINLLKAFGLFDPNSDYSLINILNTDLPESWQLANNSITPVFNSNSVSYINTELIHNILFFVPSNRTNKTGSKSGELILDNNLALSGELNYQATNYNYDTSNYHRKMSIRGVKLSDATRLTEANEIELKVQLQEEVIDSLSSFDCLRTVNWQSELSYKKNDLEVKTNHRHQLATIHIDDSNELHIDHNLLTFKQSATYNTLFYAEYSNLCLDTGEYCRIAPQLKQHIHNHNLGFSFTSDITTEEGNQYQSEVSLTIKP